MCVQARFFDGFAGSAFLSVSGGTVSDLFRPDAIQAPMIIISMAPFVGPSLGPLLGGFINYNVDWRWTFYVGARCYRRLVTFTELLSAQVMLIWAGVMMVCVVVLVPETYRE
jgi:MFS family permease